MVSKSISLKFHNKAINQYTQIDKYFLVPKKVIDFFPEGEIVLLVDGKKIKTRVYNIFCDCRPEKHTHRIIDLRDYAEKLSLENGKESEVGVI